MTEVSGRGVGLGALQHAVHELGGRISVISSPGVGTTLRIDLPRAAASPIVAISTSGGKSGTRRGLPPRPARAA